MARTDIKEITERLEKGVKEVFTSDKYIEYLDFMGKFYDYSFNNTMLIYMQMPEASLVAGYKAWKTKFNRQVRKGEKGIKIIAPCPHKGTRTNKAGEEEEYTWMSFTTATVFDVSQTDGDDIPTGVCNELTGDVQNFKILAQRLEKVSPVKIYYEDINDGSNGFYSLIDKRIAIRSGMSEQQTIKTMIHEIAHAILHDKETGELKDADHFSREVQAESVAYTVCSMLGLDTSDYSFGYIAGWSSNKDAKELSESMDAIRATAKTIFEGLKN